MKDRVIDSKNYKESKLMHFLLLVMVMIQVSLPEDVFAATSLQKLTKDSTGFVMGDVKDLFIGGGALFGFAAALVKGSIKVAGIVTAILIMYAIATAWQSGGMVVLA